MRDYQAVIDASNRAIDLARRAGMRYDVGASLHNLGDARSRLGDRQGAYSAFAESSEIAESLGNVRLAMLNRMHLAYLDGVGGDAGAPEVLRKLIDDAQAQGFLTDVREGQLRLGALLTHLGATQDARRVLEGLLALATSQRDQALEMDARELLAKL